MRTKSEREAVRGSSEEASGPKKESSTCSKSSAEETHSTQLTETWGSCREEEEETCQSGEH